MNIEAEREVFENMLFYGKNPKLLAHNGKCYTDRNTRRMFGTWLMAKRHELTKQQVVA